MTTLQQITAGTGADTRVNENFQQTSPAALYARDPVTSIGLTWGYKGGQYNANTIADGAVALTASATNYVVANRTTGAVSAATTLTNWNDATNYLRLYSVITGTATVTSFADNRQIIGMTANSFAGGTLTSALNEAPTATIASAASVAIGASAGNTVNVTGTTAITSFDAIAAGAVRRLLFPGALVLTHNAASLICLGGGNITTAAGDSAQFLSLGAGNWEMVEYSRANGSPLVIASAAVLGGVKVGAGLAVAGDGTMSASGAAPGTQTLTDFANAAGTTTGLTYGYQAGVIRADNVVTAVAAGTVLLTASTTNYVEVTGAGAVSANTVGFTSGRFPLATVVTGVSTITTITDKRGVIALGGVQLGGINVYTKSQSVTPSALTSGASIALDASLSNNFKLVLGVNATLANPTNPTDGMVVNIRIRQDATGSRTLAYGTAYKWPGGAAGVLSTAANAVDLLSMYYDSTDAVWACVLQKGFA
jgi:hypothetical protein